VKFDPTSVDGAIIDIYASGVRSAYLTRKRIIIMDNPRGYCWLVRAFTGVPDGYTAARFIPTGGLGCLLTDDEGLLSIEFTGPGKDYATIVRYISTGSHRAKGDPILDEIAEVPPYGIVDVMGRDVLAASNVLPAMVAVRACALIKPDAVIVSQRDQGYWLLVAIVGDKLMMYAVDTHTWKLLGVV
jgi:hypothetical protein